MEDLKNAEESLTRYDPVIETGAVWGDDPEGGVNDMRYRSMRLNYAAAVQALMVVWLSIAGKGRGLGAAEKNDS